MIAANAILFRESNNLPHEKRNIYIDGKSFHFLNIGEGRRKIEMIESRIYVGLKDQTTRTQLFENEKYINVLRKDRKSVV